MLFLQSIDKSKCIQHMVLCNISNLLPKRWCAYRNRNVM